MTTADARPEPLAIVGIGCLFPKAACTGFFWANVKSGTDCITEVPATHWNPDDYFDPDPKKPDMTYARRGGFLSAVEFNPLEFGVPPNDIEATDTTQLLGLVAAKQALVDARIRFADAKNQTPNAVDRDRVSIILGVTGTLELVIPLGARLGHPKCKRAMRDAGVPADRIEDAAARIAESYVPWQENSFPGLLGNVVAGRIANKLDLGGTNCVVDAACASSLSAVHLAALELQAGRCDVAVTGGCDTFNDIFMYMCFSKTPALSPTGDAKPFDAAGDGTILGEGLGVVVLKRLRDAEAAGDTVYAVLKAVGSSSDGKGKAIYEPSAAGQKKALQRAYTLAGVSPDTIELVEAHGTGTKVGDTVEVTALAEVYGAHTERPRPWCAVGSVKSQIGHTKAAAGAASLIKAALALHNKVLPPTIKVKHPVEPLRAADSPFYVSTEARPWLPRAEHPRRAALSAFGFGGSNFHAVLEEHAPAKRHPDWDGQTEIVALSAPTPHALAAALAALPTEWDAFARAAEASRAAFDAKAECRLCFAAHRTHTDLPKLLDGAKQKLGAKPEAAWSTADGAHYGRGIAKGTVAVLFPGQGSQYVGMLRDLACLFPEALDSLATANAALSDRLSDRVFPPGAFDPDLKKEYDRALRNTRNAQPALGAASFGAWRVLHERFGLSAESFAGHSYGELVALAAADRYTERDLYSLSRLRGELMARGRGGEAGTMLAAFAGPDEIEKALGASAPKVVIANRNAPKQTVLSGPTDAIARASELLTAAGIKASKLAVAAAFHSPLVADAAGPFRAALGSVAFGTARAAVYANTTAAPYPAEAESAKDLLANQLAKPVAFVDQIRALHATGVRTFVEVGPGSVLTRLVEAILADAPHESLALDASGGKRPGALDLAHLLARLAAGGRAVALSEWERDSTCRPAPVPAKRANTVAICGANWVQPRTPRAPLPALEVGSPRAATASAPSRGSAMSPSPQDPGALAQALQLTQQTLAALQRMQEQTAALHKQFLDTQEASQRTLHALVEQQVALLTGAPLAPLAPLPPAAPPKTVPVAPLAPPRAEPPAPQPPATQVLSSALLPPMALAGKKIVREPAPAPSNDVHSVLLAVVSEKTGYPADSLDLSLSLDADLGVDSIKRVEILSALQEKLPSAPAVKPEHLGTLHTLKDVADFLGASAAPAPAARAPHPEEALARTQQVDREQLALIRGLNEPAPTAGVTATLLAVVSEKTGYPADSLDLSLSLDADLGVDSIKRVEILSALQEKLPSAPAVKPEHLGTLHTLKDVADFLTNGPVPATTKIPQLLGADSLPTKPITPLMEIEPAAPDTVRLSRAAPVLAGPAPAARAVPREMATARQAAPFGGDRIDRSILQVVDVDLTVHRSRLPLAGGGEFWIVADAGPLATALAEQVRAAGFAPRAFGWADAATAQVPAGALSGLLLVAPVHPDPQLNRRAFDWLQVAGAKLRATGRAGGAVLATVARLDGAFGLLDLSPDADTTAGGLAGLDKTAKYEWPEVHCKALDLAPDVTDALGAPAVADEVLGSGPAEVGIGTGHRSALELARTARRPGAQLVALGVSDVILVTGGARGVTADVVAALAETYAPALVLTGRTPLAPADPPHLAGLTAEADLKRAITDALGPAAGPRAVGEAYKQVLAQREIRATLERVKAAGAKVAYFAVDATDGPAVADLVQQVRARFGPITGLIHAAGVLADKRIEDLSGDQFDRVYATKVDGLRALLDLLAYDDLKLLVLFSSTTARLGRVGQAAYACANEVLNKTAQVEARRRPQCRTVAINWGPWDGGMVTPALKKVFEGEGVGVIPPFEGAMFLIQELSAAGRAAEVVALAPPPARPAPGSGGVPRPGGGAQPVPAGGAPAPAPTAGEPTLAFERALDVTSHPVLRSHVLDGLAVFPLALHTEWLAHAALHNNPGMQFHGFNDLRVTSGLKVEAGEHLPVRALAGKAVKQDKHFTVSVELRGARKGGREQVYSRAGIVLVPALPPAPPADAPPSVVAVPYDVPKAYRELLFHGPELHGIASVRGAAPLAFVGTAFPAPPPAEWFAAPLRSAWVADPLVLDSAFQMMILWTQGRYGTGSLPTFAGRYRQFRKAFPTDPVTVVIRVTRDDARFARADIDFLTADGQIVAQMQDYECIIEPNLSAAFRKNKLGK
jgi:acyl transferase domain-containing protein/acyl carrier protein/NADP-dependent 3-hydroxy acid dehydrogenase YdfG